MPYLFGVKVDKAVAPRLALHRTCLVEQEVKLLHLPKSLQQLDQVVPTHKHREEEAVHISTGSMHEADGQVKDLNRRIITTPQQRLSS